MRRMITRVALGLALATSVLADELEEPTGSLTRDQALELALARNPELRAGAHDVRAAEARTAQAGRLPNPELEVVVAEYDRGGQGFDSAEVEVGIGQTIELGGKRHWRTRMAAAESALAESDYEGTRLDVLASTAQRFAEVLAAQRRLELARSTIAIAEKTTSAVTERVKAGKEPPLQASKASAELELARIELEEIENDLAAARRALAAMWGSGEARFDSVEGDLEAVPAAIPSLGVVRARLPVHPSMARWEIALQRQQAAVSSERSARMPDLAVSVGLQQFEEDDTDSLMFGVGLPLPLFDRNQGNIAAAQHDLAKVEAERRAAELSLHAELMETHAKLTSSHKRVDALRTRVVPAMQEAFEAAHTGYQQGKYDFLDMLDAQRGLFETRGALVDALSDYQHSLADLERITGATIEQLLNDTEESLR